MKVEDTGLSALLAAGRLPGVGMGLLSQRALTERFVGLLGLVRSGRPAHMHTLFGSFLVPVTGADARGLLNAAVEAEALGTADEVDPAGRRHRLPECAPLPEVPREFMELIGAAAEDAVEELSGELTLGWSGAARRLARRLVLDAGEDTLLDRLAVGSGTERADRRREDRRAALDRRIRWHLESLKPDCFAAMTGAGPHSPIAVDGLAHLLTAMIVTAETVGPRALALLAADGYADRAHVEAAVRRAVGVWPEVFGVVQRVARGFEWDGVEVGAGVEVLVLSSVLGKGGCVGDGGGVGEVEWQLSGLCAAPRRCVTRELALAVTTELLVAALANGRPQLLAPKLNPARPPAQLDPRRVRVELLAFGAPPRLSGLEATAAELEQHASALRDLAADQRWDHADGLRTRGVLLGHARRCAVAAEDVRRTARALP
ncbi:MAG: hypothetical protein HOW97_31970 [Catenulispora sp.]|nr:hypothetical protein [Catenulispora sp.]